MGRWDVIHVENSRLERRLKRESVWEKVRRLGN